ncbi:MAG: DUF4268 domain-containing protein [Natrialbaceae archaeon]|nr:DUF4268 domain-containing protein [Natrialbaceae archaeon]
MSIAGSDERGFEFNVIVEPNEWEREMEESESLSETERAYKEFFRDLVDAYSDRRSDWTKLKAGARNYLTFGSGKGRVRFGWVFHRGPEFTVELYISRPSGKENAEIFESLKRDEKDIESNLGKELVWEELPEKQACRIKWSNEIEGRITTLSEDQRSELIEWGIEAMDAFYDEFEPRVSGITLSGS